jgi:hypothetical protein
MDVRGTAHTARAAHVIPCEHAYRKPSGKPLSHLYIPFYFAVLLSCVAVLEHRNDNKRDAMLATWLMAILTIGGSIAVFMTWEMT